nr:uncharacterized protein LOC109185271 [Ipomoea batatas]
MSGDDLFKRKVIEIGYNMDGPLSNGEGCASNAENCEESDGNDDSGKYYDGSEEDLISYALGNDDEEFDNNIDVNVEYGGLDDVEIQHQEKASLATVACDEISYSDEGSIAGSDRKRKGTAKVFERD